MANAWGGSWGTPSAWGDSWGAGSQALQQPSGPPRRRPRRVIALPMPPLLVQPEFDDEEVVLLHEIT